MPPNQPAPAAPKNTFEEVSVTLRDYGSKTAFPGTSKLFVVARDAGRPNEEISEAACVGIGDKSVSEKTPVNQRVHEVLCRDFGPGSLFIPRVGVIVIDGKMDPFLGGLPRETENKFIALHELGHANLKQMAHRKDGSGASDYAAGGWERALPSDLLRDFRYATGNIGTYPPREYTATNPAAYREDMAAFNKLEQSKNSVAVRVLQGLVGETYADAFAALSISARDGTAAGVTAAVATMRARELEARPGEAALALHRATTPGAVNHSFEDIHDSSRGMSILATNLEKGQIAPYLQGLSKEKLPVEIHRLALEVSVANLSRWAHAHGMAEPQAKKLADWVAENYRQAQAENTTLQVPKPAAVVPRTEEQTRLTQRAAQLEKEPAQREMSLSKTPK